MNKLYSSEDGQAVKLLCKWGDLFLNWKFYDIWKNNVTLKKSEENMFVHFFIDEQYLRAIDIYLCHETSNFSVWFNQNT